MLSNAQFRSTDSSVTTTLNERGFALTATNTTTPKKEPTHGWTGRGIAVHGRVLDHMSEESAYQRFNKRVALALTRYVGTMTCFWIFCVLALCSLPAVLSGFNVFKGFFPSVIIKASIIALVSWVAQTFLQLVLLPSLMVGQNLQNEAADAWSAKTFEDVERLMTLLDLKVVGGITDFATTSMPTSTASSRRRRHDKNDISRHRPTRSAWGSRGATHLAFR